MLCKSVSVLVSNDRPIIKKFVSKQHPATLGTVNKHTQLETKARGWGGALGEAPCLSSSYHPSHFFISEALPCFSPDAVPSFPSLLSLGVVK